MGHLRSLCWACFVPLVHICSGLTPLKKSFNLFDDASGFFWLPSNIWMLIIDCVAVSLERKALEGSAHFTLFSLSDVFTCSSQLYFDDRCKYYLWEGQTGRKENSDTCLSFVIKNKKCYKCYKKCGSAALIWIPDNYSGINFPEHHRVWFKFKTLKVIFTFWKKKIKN